MWWTQADYPLIDDADVVPTWFTGALVSRADSGRIYWDKAVPRSYVRGAVYDVSGALVESSQRTGGVDGDLVLTVNPRSLTSAERAEAQRGYTSGAWLYAGQWMQGFGHFVAETLPMLWPLIDAEHSIEGVVAHRFTSLKRYDWQFELVNDLVGRRALQIVEDAPGSFERLLVPPRPYRYQQAISPMTKQVWDRIAESGGGGLGASPDRVYLSRAHFDTTHSDADERLRGFVNAERVDEVFRAHGFEVLYPEEMPVAAQIAAVRNAQVVAGPGGSALHLAAFMQNGRVLEVGDRRFTSHPVSTQVAIAAARDQPIAQVPFLEAGPGELDIKYLKERLAVLDLT